MWIMCWLCCPFEVKAHKELHGPDCSYVGHPLIERLDVLRPGIGRAFGA